MVKRFFEKIVRFGLEKGRSKIINKNKRFSITVILEEYLILLC